MKEWILESRSMVVLWAVLQAVLHVGFLIAAVVVVRMVFVEWQEQEVVRHAKDRQECVRGGGAWQEGRVGIFTTESCVRSR